VAAVLAIAGLIGVSWWSGTYNDAVKLDQGCQEQWAQVENVYQRQSDLIPNLVETVKGQTNFEKSTLVEVAQARASMGQIKLTPQMLADPKAMAQFNQAQSGLAGALSRLLVVSERYPDLKANTAFMELRAELAGSQNRIAVERLKYNKVVRSYNTLLGGFFSGMVIRHYGDKFQAGAYFKADEGAKAAPKVSF
jgi:LemA protein